MQPQGLVHCLRTRVACDPGANDRTPGGAGLGVLPVLRTCRRGFDLRCGAAAPTLRLARLRDRDAGQDGVGEAADELVRAAQSGTAPWTAPRVAAGLSRSRPSPDGGHCDKPER